MPVGHTVLDYHEDKLKNLTRQRVIRGCEVQILQVREISQRILSTLNHPKECISSYQIKLETRISAKSKNSLRVFG